MTKHEIMRHFLGMNYRQYDNYRQGCFVDWCRHWAGKKALFLGMMMCNEALYGWYCTQWVGRVEADFYTDFSYYMTEGVEDPPAYLSLFMTYPGTIKAYYPGALLALIEKDWKTKIHE